MGDIERFLRDKNVRPTAMRLLAFRFMAQKKTAISLTELEAFFEKSDRTTLYRTLKTFEENGIVHQINDGRGFPNMPCTKMDAIVRFITTCICIPTVPNVKKHIALPITVFRKFYCQRAIRFRTWTWS